MVRAGSAGCAAWSSGLGWAAPSDGALLAFAALSCCAFDAVVSGALLSSLQALTNRHDPASMAANNARSFARFMKAKRLPFRETLREDLADMVCL